MKREKYLTWNEYFMGLAELSSQRSKDPKTGVGCCIVDPNNNRVVSLGYNGFPKGCSDDVFPWTKSSGRLSENKYAYVVHAELNAILNSERSLKGCTIYVTYSPCNECMKAIIQSGITTVIYKEEYDKGSEGWLATKKMAEYSGVKLIKYKN